MDQIECHDLNSNQVNPEEDSEYFFLQPASSPYDIRIKIKMANEELLNEIVKENRELRVKFTDEFLYYEPESNSILDTITSARESEEENIRNVTDEKETLEMLEKSFENSLNFVEEDEEIPEKILDERNEEILSLSEENNSQRCPSVLLGCCKEFEEVYSFQEENVNDENDSVDTLNGFEDIEENEEFVLDLTEKSELNTKLDLGISEESTSEKHHLEPINCRNHCIDRFDSVEEKLRKKPPPVPSCCPMLRLRKRSCCEKNEFKKHQKLPAYTGKRSEYGMSSKEKKEAKRKKVLEEKLKKEEEKLQEELRKRRIEENEKIFAKWLQEISKRKKHQHKQRERRVYSERLNRDFSPYASTISKNRPNTAHYNSNNSKRNLAKKKRPQTCPANICIEIPADILKKGLIIGDVKILARDDQQSDDDFSYHLLEFS